MKVMTCKQLGGACDMEFKADTFDEMAQMSQQHGMDMFQKNDAAHLEAMSKMKAMMAEPDAVKSWMDERRKEFEALPEA